MRRIEGGRGRGGGWVIRRAEGSEGVMRWKGLQAVMEEVPRRRQRGTQVGAGWYVGST